MSRRAFLGFLVLNIVVTFAVATAVILLNDMRRNSGSPEATSTLGNRLLQVVITATPNPNETPQVVYVVVTATPDSGIRIQPTPEDGTLAASGDIATLDPALLPPALEGSPAASAIPDGNACPTYALQNGDTAGVVAQRNNVSLVDLMRANDLTEGDLIRLQIGQVLIIPTAGCGLPTPTPIPTDAPTLTATPPPTATDVPTLSADQTQIEVVRVLSPGDITAEGVEIRNISGSVVEIGGWQMRDKDGNTFTFPDYQLFEGRRMVVYTRGGDNTPLALFWGLPQALWSDPTQVVVITDADGRLQVRFSARDALGAPIPTPTP